MQPGELKLRCELDPRDADDPVTLGLLGRVLTVTSRLELQAGLRETKGPTPRGSARLAVAPKRGRYDTEQCLGIRPDRFTRQTR